MDSVALSTTENITDSQSAPVWMKRVPLITGVLAGLAGFLTVRSANMSNLANYNSTQAVLHQAKSSDAWNEYEAASLKRHGDENVLRIGVADEGVRKQFQAEVAEFRTRQDIKKPEAEQEAKLRDAELVNGQQKLAIKDLLDYAGVAAQLAIALASVAALTRRKIAYDFGLFAGAIAILITAYALVEPYAATLLARH